ncbi:MAG: LysR family transcriptional regulator [Methylococcus sp.]|nr:LysR family transcriptional regulator [Methylococcus sp.]
MFMRQIGYLVALAKTGHFGRAAEICHVSQPALSTALQHLETELGVTLIQRGQRFQGFTPEGERLLEWARRVQADCEGMRQAAAQIRGNLSGVLRLGAIPTTLAVSPLFTESLQRVHPGIRLSLHSCCAEEIIRGLDTFEFDLGLTYLEDPRLRGFQVLPLYRETHVLLARDGTEAVPGQSIGWREAAELPLCLLSADMQNRRLIDAAFRDAGATPRVMVETDSVFALYAHVRCAGLYSVVPHSLLTLFEMRQEVTAVPLRPELSRQIGLVARNHQMLPPILAEAWTLAESLGLQARLDGLINASY